MSPVTKRRNLTIEGGLSFTHARKAVRSIIIAGDLYPSPAFNNLLSDDKQNSLMQLRAILRSSDLAMVNLECPLTESKTAIAKSGPHLSANPIHARTIREIGFNAVTLANNHILDMGGKGISDTLVACKRAGLKTVGAGVDHRHAVAPLIVNLNGFILGILSLTENEFSLATEATAGAAPLDTIENYHQICELKKKVDFILVIIHGGNEYYPLPRPGLVKTCRFLVDSGASAVVCHHAHVPGGMEVYKNVPIFYCIGNFFFEWPGKPVEWHQGYLVRLLIQRKSQVRFDMIPYYQCQGDADIRLMEGDVKRKFLRRTAGLSRLISNRQKLLYEWNIFCLKEKGNCFTRILGLNKVERRLLKIGIWQFWRTSAGRIRVLLNLFRCQSHREVCIDVLETEMKKLVKKHK